LAQIVLIADILVILMISHFVQTRKLNSMLVAGCVVLYGTILAWRGSGKMSDIDDFVDRIISMDIPVDDVISGEHIFYFCDGSRYRFNESEFLEVRSKLTEIYRVLEEKIKFDEEGDDC
jgi:hypothetical protein